ncbi:hypothetical protein MML48_3g00004145 [Holotrichia oblita]|uniref:Uncharacterized protein n=1 Tax=Holotrichia oblita TaxID=644536 RepID=A0ACB9TFI8_HOLOL|nr:hypothetical protein MML48_3g00004145 [Holotrichia oblita]
MTMDINNRKPDLKSEIVLSKNGEEQTQITNSSKSTKRSFDVAFLMLPDDKLKQKQKVSKPINYDINVTSDESNTGNNDQDDSDEDIEVGNIESPRDFIKSKYISQKQQIFDDPNLSKPRQSFNLDGGKAKFALNISPEQKSAFTKVSLNKESRMSPNLSISPDLSYQNSLSPSPPIVNRNYQNFSNMLSQNQIFKAQNTYQHAFIQENLNNFTAPVNSGIENHFLMKANNPELLPPNLVKMRPMLAQYRPDLSYNYHQFQNQEMLKLAQPDLKFPPEMRNPAAAILTSLLPPSLAALSLPAQNVCAKCNITFRMTSDLVYHMRSHHKNDSSDYTKRKREEKLKCPVCQESFRERHHLTRHMTAHQDKDKDEAETGTEKKKFSNFGK